jgi:hypothetical protein
MVASTILIELFLAAIGVAIEMFFLRFSSIPSGEVISIS